MSTKYIKINTLWKRDPETNKILTDQITCPEFKAIKKFYVTEKIHGRNTRIEFDASIVNGVTHILGIRFYGKTKDAEFKPKWYRYMMKTFTTDRLKKMIRIRTDKEGNNIDEAYHVTLYGELFGAGIQKGGENYSMGTRFALFDVKIGRWWLEQKNVIDIAKKIGIPAVPFLGILTLEEIIDLVKSKYKSKIAGTDHTAEGVVARSHPLMLFRDGNPIIFKLKAKDFEGIQSTTPPFRMGPP